MRHCLGSQGEPSLYLCEKIWCNREVSYLQLWHLVVCGAAWQVVPGCGPQGGQSPGCRDKQHIIKTITTFGIYTSDTVIHSSKLWRNEVTMIIKHDEKAWDIVYKLKKLYVTRYNVQYPGWKVDLKPGPYWGRFQCLQIPPWSVPHLESQSTGSCLSPFPDPVGFCVWIGAQGSDVAFSSGLHQVWPTSVY